MNHRSESPIATVDQFFPRVERKRPQGRSRSFLTDFGHTGTAVENDSASRNLMRRIQPNESHWLEIQFAPDQNGAVVMRSTGPQNVISKRLIMSV